MRMESGKSVLYGILSLLGIVALYLVLRHFLPGLSVLLLVVLGLIALGIIVIVAVVLVLAFRKPKDPGKPSTSEVTAQIAQGRSKLVELRQLAMHISDQQIRQLSDEICVQADKILRTLKEQPEELSRVWNFFDYYLPTLGKILQKFRQLEQNGVLTRETTEKTVACLTDIRTAMERQHASLFDDDVFDLAAEMKVMTEVCKRDGLL